MHLLKYVAHCVCSAQKFMLARKMLYINTVMQNKNKTDTTHAQATKAHLLANGHKVVFEFAAQSKKSKMLARTMCSAKTVQALDLLEIANWPGNNERKPIECITAEQKLVEMGAVDADGCIRDEFENGELSAYWNTYCC